MTVKELIEQLQEYKPNTEVIVSCDSEGNTYTRCGRVYSCKTRTSNDYCFEVICDEDIESGYYDDEDLVNVVERCVIYPC